MHRTQFSNESARIEGGTEEAEPSGRSSKLVFPLVLLTALIIVAAAFQSVIAAATEEGPRLPYTTIDHPQFIPTSQAKFLHANDVLIGVTHGNVAKAYPAAILAQHGVVQDQMPDGPIAVTW